MCVDSILHASVACVKRARYCAVVTHEQRPLGPTEVVAGRVRELRKRKGWSGARLAGELALVGLPWDRSIVANLENGRRASVSVEELLALAYVLDVAPVHLLVPVENDVPYRPTPVWETDSARVREWVRGREPLTSTDPRTYFSEVPTQEWEPPSRSSGSLSERLDPELLDLLRRHARAEPGKEG